MATLINRATPRQVRVYRIVRGAVRNAAAAHPKWPFDDRLAGSIAKRAAGTLTAAWPDVLAVPAGVPSEQPIPPDVGGGAEATSRGRREQGRHRPATRLLRRLRHDVSVLAGGARHTGHAERLAAYVEVLRAIHRLIEHPA